MGRQATPPNLLNAHHQCLAAHCQKNSRAHGNYFIRTVFNTNHAVVDAINIWLRVSPLSQVPGTLGYHPFATWPADGCRTLDYQVRGITRRYLSLAIFTSYRDPGDTYEYARFYNFDLHSGSYFILQETLTPDGLTRLSYQGCLRDSNENVRQLPATPLLGKDEAFPRNGNQDAVHARTISL
jgi:hypothetical protein